MRSGHHSYLGLTDAATRKNPALNRPHHNWRMAAPSRCPPSQCGAPQAAVPLNAAHQGLGGGGSTATGAASSPSCRRPPPATVP